MQIIPVIDLKDQQVVLAKSGDRQNYQPVSTSLCPSSDVFDVIHQFLNLYPFPQFYIADLDAIVRQGCHDELIDSVVHQFPDIIFWIDNGLKLADYKTKFRPPNYQTIIASESQQNIQQAIPQDAILSLDFKEDLTLGDKALFTQAELWPKTIIIMTLNQIGTDNGPDFEKLKTFRQSYPDKQFVAAGGIRGFEDLLQLTQIGVNQALVASSLHAGQLSSTQIDWLFTQF
jgi:phosphoribosylformimino-5-aminoimidazole carboxamide ribotide isomerase